MMQLRDARFAFMPEQLRMDVVTLIVGRLVHFHLDAMRFGPSVLTDAGDLPGDLHAGLAGLDSKAAVCHF